MKGIVKWFSNVKQYGFIECENGGDVFVHSSGIVNAVSLEEGDKVEFEVEDSPRGDRAINVKKIKEE